MDLTPSRQDFSVLPILCCGTSLAFAVSPNARRYVYNEEEARPAEGAQVRLHLLLLRDADTMAAISLIRLHRGVPASSVDL